MFGTLTYDAQSQEPVFEAVTTLPNSISGTEPSKRVSTIHKACQLCRARKLRCSGEPSGCDRCKSSFNICRYPPRTSRVGKKRDVASPTSSRSKNHNFPVEECVASPQKESVKEKRPGQLQWQHDPTAAGFFDQDAQALSAYKLFETNYELEPPHMQSFLSDAYIFGNPEAYSPTDFFEAPWQDDALRSKSTPSSNRLPDLSSQFSKDCYKESAVLSCASPSSETPDFETLDLPGVGAVFSRAWSVTSVDRSPELSSSNSLSRSNSVETMGMHTEKADTGCSGDSGKCQCLSRVAQFLEQVETGGATSNASIDDLLKCSREPLRQRKTLLGCSCCNSRSEYVLLLAMLAKSLSVVCYTLVQQYIQSQVDADKEDLTGDAWPDVRLGAYLIQDSVEKSTVMEALIASKLDHLLDFIVSLKTRIEKREGLLASVSLAEERVRELKIRLSPIF